MSRYTATNTEPWTAHDAQTTMLVFLPCEITQHWQQMKGTIVTWWHNDTTNVAMLLWHIIRLNKRNSNNGDHGSGVSGVDSGSSDIGGFWWQLEQELQLYYISSNSLNVAAAASTDAYAGDLTMLIL